MRVTKDVRKYSVCGSPSYYSAAYFECITEFDTLQCQASVRGGAHMHFVDVSDIYAFT